MERLTEYRVPIGGIYRKYPCFSPDIIPDDNCPPLFCERAIKCNLVHMNSRKCPYLQVIDRLAAYEDAMSIERAQELAQAEKDGRLWMLDVLPQGRPGGQGSRVYVIEDGEIYDDYVVSVQIGVDSNGELHCIYEAYDGSDFYDADIGKTVFLTREEAEEALKKREEEDNETVR